MLCCYVIFNISNHVGPKSINTFIQGNAAFVLVTCSFNFRQKVIEQGRKTVKVTKHNVNKTLIYYLIGEHDHIDRFLSAMGIVKQ